MVVVVTIATIPVPAEDDGGLFLQPKLQVFLQPTPLLLSATTSHWGNSFGV